MENTISIAFNLCEFFQWGWKMHLEYVINAGCLQENDT